MGKRGRKKEYKTAAALRRGIEEYLRSITYRVPVTVEVATETTDDKGKEIIICERKKLYVDEDGFMNTEGVGKPKMVTEYLEPPDPRKLYLFLGISKQTWANYAKDEKLGAVCEEFKLLCESRLAGLLESSGGKSVQGIMFNLKNNYGWAEKIEAKQEADATIRVAMVEEAEGLAE